MSRTLSLVAILTTITIAATAAPARPGPLADTPDAVAARMGRHHETAGLKEVTKPIVGQDSVTCSAGGSIGRIQALFLDIAESEPGLEVRSVELSRAPDPMVAKGASVVVEYVVAPVAQPDDRVIKGRWTVPVILAALASGSVAAKGLTVLSAKLADGTFTVDARSQNADGSKSVEKLLDAGPTRLVKSVTIDQKAQRQIVRDPKGDVPQTAVTLYAFKLVATYDASGVSLDIIKRMAYQ